MGDYGNIAKVSFSHYILFLVMILFPKDNN